MAKKFPYEAFIKRIAEWCEQSDCILEVLQPWQLRIEGKYDTVDIYPKNRKIFWVDRNKWADYRIDIITWLEANIYNNN